MSANDVASVGGGSMASKSTLGMHSTRSATSRSRIRKQKRIIKWPTLIRETFMNLFDLVGDWTYFYSIYTRYYVGEVDADDEENNNLLLELENVVLVLLGFCVLSTFLSLWTIQTTTLATCGKKSMCCNCTVPRLSLLGIMLEDVPQFVLTCYIDYNLVGSLTPAAVMNICSSLSAFVVRLTSRYEQVQDDKNIDDKLKPIVEFEM